MQNQNYSQIQTGKVDKVLTSQYALRARFEDQVKRPDIEPGKLTALGRMLLTNQRLTTLGKMLLEE